MNGQKSLFLSLLIVPGSTAGLFVLRRVLFGVLHRIAGLRIPSLIFVIILSAYIGIRLADLPGAWIVIATKGLHLSIILAITMGLANVSDQLLAASPGGSSSFR